MLVIFSEQLNLTCEAKEVLEEDMKQAFMRITCAANIEAISVMNRPVSKTRNDGNALQESDKENLEVNVIVGEQEIPRNVAPPEAIPPPNNNEFV